MCNVIVVVKPVYTGVVMEGNVVVLGREEEKALLCPWNKVVIFDVQP